MSIHSSLRGVNTLVGDRSVLTRIERINKLLKDGKFDPENGSPYGLPKVRTKFKVAKVRRKPEGEGEAAAPAAEAEAGS